MAKRQKEFNPEDWTFHTCIEVDDQIVCIDSWPRDVRSKILAHAIAPVIPLLNPGYEAVLNPCCYDLDVRKYITPECIVRFPYMENRTQKNMMS